MSTLEDDIHFARNLAESGHQAPLLGGRFLVWWGGLTGAAYAIHFLLLENVSRVPSGGFTLLWLGFGMVAPIGYWLIGRRYPFHLPGSGSQGNQTERAVWMTVGLMLLSLIIGAVTRVLLGHSPEQVFPSTVPGVMGGFAVAQYVTGWISGSGMLKAAGGLALALVGVCFALVDNTLLYGLASLGTFLTVFLPGLLLWRQESRSLG